MWLRSLKVKVIVGNCFFNPMGLSIFKYANATAAFYSLKGDGSYQVARHCHRDRGGWIHSHRAL